jgi:hypothetical protein
MLSVRTKIIWCEDDAIATSGFKIQPQIATKGRFPELHVLERRPLFQFEIQHFSRATTMGALSA